MAGRPEGFHVAVVMLIAVSLTACRDVGLLGNMPRELAENRQFRYTVYQAVEGQGPTARTVPFDQRSWLASSEVIPVPERLMQSVGSAGGTELFAPAWATAPHARLYVRAQGGGWHPMTPVI